MSTPDGISLNVTATAFNASNPIVEPIDLWAVKEVREELELIDEQVAEMRNVYSELQEKLDAKFSSMTEKEMGERLNEIQEFGLEMRDNTKKKFEELLLPMQVKRLETCLSQERPRALPF